ncbi:hypothetical protein EDD18DRAFT_1354101 [Armillaria luteobubalina]|uniref:Uncharacterized protein n=1 Tax=Armillaria luteobubalina TaxID=153913 RepID=A0AA39Q3J1_9AGAR|nr:hypothetical protein EDD18DRAFT_1354101 [Armillaria luteobubalina]
MISHGIPLWVYWGHLDKQNVGCYGEKCYEPTECELWDALKRREELPEMVEDDGARLAIGLCRGASGGLGTWEVDDFVQKWLHVVWLANPSSLELPVQRPMLQYEPLEKMEKPHQQCLGETWQDFFLHHMACNAKIMESESEQACQACLQREGHGKNFQMMGSKGVAVFTWRVSDEKGYCICRNIFHGKWDLNSDFDPMAHFETEDKEEEEEDYFGQPVEKEGLGLCLVRQEGSKLHPEKLETATLKKMLVMVHGIFIPPSEMDAASMSAIKTQKVERCKSSLSGKAVERDTYNVISNKQLSMLYDGLFSWGNVPHQFPVEWSDLDPSLPQYLLKAYNKSFKVLKIKMAKGSEAVFVISDGKKTNYELIIPCASMVLLALCHASSHTLDELTEYLCTWGI